MRLQHMNTLQNYSKLVNEHLKDCQSQVVQPDCRCLPQFYWLPKIHKKPYKASKCQKESNHFRQYCNGIFCRTGSTVFGL